MSCVANVTKINLANYSHQNFELFFIMNHLEDAMEVCFMRCGWYRLQFCLRDLLSLATNS